MTDAFDILDRPLAWIEVRWPELVQVDEESLAESVERVIEVQVELLDDREELARLFGFSAVFSDLGIASGDEGEVVPAEPPKPATDWELWQRLVKNWRRIKAGNEPLPFTEENSRRLLARPAFGTGFQASYLLAIAGKARVREGNSEGSRANGRAGGSARKPRPKRTRR